MKKVLLTTLNAKYIHKNLALRWLYVCAPKQANVVLKEYTIKESLSFIVQDILSMQVDVVGFSCYIWNIEPIKDIIQQLKRQRSDLSILVGGPEVSYESYDLLDIGVDAISIGEGEESFWEYVEMLEAKKPYEVEGIYTKDFPNTTYRKSDVAFLETKENPYFLAMDDQDQGKRYCYLETSRGCPYGCTYCLSSCDHDLRLFSEDYVLHILDQIAHSDIQQVKLLDRTFNSHPQRALRLARYMNTHCKNQIFQFEVVAETLSEELLQFFCEEADPGRFRFEIGVQSFNETTLRSVGRHQNKERLLTVIDRLRAHGCILHVDLIAGLPYEGMESFQASFDTLFQVQASELQLGILKLLKGTRLRQQQEQFSMRFQNLPPYDVQATKWLSEAELHALHACGEAVEKFWNSGMCSFIIQAILDQGWYESAFALFMDLGKEYERLPRPYQPHHLFSCFYPLLKNHPLQEVEALLLSGYYPRFKQKPHRFVSSHIALEKKKELLWFALQEGIANQDQLFRYGVADIGCDGKGRYGYQLVLYNAHQSYPRQWFIDADMTYLKEMPGGR